MPQSLQINSPSLNRYEAVTKMRDASAYTGNNIEYSLNVSTRPYYYVLLVDLEPVSHDNNRQSLRHITRYMCVKMVLH